ncbi:hypothetical protein AZI86_00285 [Bdellovibrio bacteriovorus]|uniref:DUF1552 domain-containing protein n=1 Tax=Bdellovibrio bacteriovorus TaxID=959 RepID=A0A150WM34_BDEBC|nr:DUF1552 domain-containing protein [Bdellovibrio bacteriovorus]KYG65553.1 hypothetical protein AZI86_00285 [Bdellovibrio bacteriovorus]
MKYNPITRRYFLKGLGSAVVYLPILSSLSPREAFAQTRAHSRFIVIGQDNGFHTPNWLPPTSNKSRMTLNGTFREMRLTDVTGPQTGAISNILGPEFSSLRSKMMLLENLDTVCPWTRGHQMATILCGNFGRVWSDAKYFGPSIDRVMARSSKIYPTASKIDGLHLRVEQLQSEPEIDLSWDYRNGQMVFPTVYDQPQAAFDAIFGTQTTGNAQAAQKEILLVDQVNEQFKLLRNNSRTSSADKKVLDEHMAMIFDLQKRLTASAPTCTPGTRPSRTYRNYAPEDRSALIDLHTQILVAAVKCGLTRIATLSICRGVDDLNYNSLVGINLPHGWHEQSHIDYTTAEVLKIYQFYSKKVAALLTALDVPESGTDGTYLDNSIVLYGNGQSEGDHRYSNRPTLIAGGGAGAINMNKYIDYGGFNNVAAPYGPNYTGRNYNQLLIAMMQAMGLSEEDYYTSDMVARGIQAGFGDDRAPNNYKSDRRNPLPGILKAA